MLVDQPVVEKNLDDRIKPMKMEFLVGELGVGRPVECAFINPVFLIHPLNAELVPLLKRMRNDLMSVQIKVHTTWNFGFELLYRFDLRPCEAEVLGSLPKSPVVRKKGLFHLKKGLAKDDPA